MPVLLPYPFPGRSTTASRRTGPKPGDIVLVPLNRREEVGVVWDAPADDTVPAHKLKSVVGVLDTPPMGDSLRRFIDWIAAYTLSPPGDVLAMALRVVSGAIARRRALSARRSVAGDPTDTAAAAGSGCAGRRGARLAADLMRRSEVSAAVLRAMTAAGLLATEAARAAIAVPAPRSGPSGTGAVGPANRSCRACCGGGRTTAVFGHAAGRRHRLRQDRGLPGGRRRLSARRSSGAGDAARNRPVLTVDRAVSAPFRRRPRGVAFRSAATRPQDHPQAVAEGAAPVVVGARSALFLPFPDLGLVVVDEEHEAAFKQQDGVIYNARDMAIVRARLCACPAVLVSATPSLETVVNVEAGRYAHLRLSSRHGGATLPKIELVDLRETPPDRGRFLAPPLIEAVRQTLTRGEQAMLFLNRRGYAPLTLCRRCGHRMQCPNCTAWLVEHRTRHAALPSLRPHHPDPTRMPCVRRQGQPDPRWPRNRAHHRGGRAVFPDARRLIMASDTISGPNAAAEAAHAIEEREVDLIIGTQLVAKGWHFPHLTFVGVVDADLGLAGGELRASERTVQLLHQVAGRAGRAEAPGRVMLQTFMPDHPVMQALLHGDLDAFMASEAESRRDGDWPPYGRLAALIVSADTALMADTLARDLARAAPRDEGATVLGPAPAPMALLRGRHRRRLLLKVRRDMPVQPILRTWLSAVRIPRGSKVDVDVDPISFL